MLNKIISQLFSFLLNLRVAISLGLLAGSKMLTVCVPFLFKGAVDTLSTLTMDTPGDTVLSVATAMLVGCKLYSNTDNVESY